MRNNFYTLGMAGHIDHGKTTLTKALTNVDTDRLKEEKERQISIELGYAPLHLDEDTQVSIIDVPGHERFIRQMIAGVAGIDLVILVVAGDEGVMPQTKEHLQILSFLGIQHGIVAITKIDRVEQEFIELVKEEIHEQLMDTVFENSAMIPVDSISNKGMSDLKEAIKKELLKIESRNASGPFRLPIDQVFSVIGQGTVVRGTIYEGQVKEGEQLTILPSDLTVKSRQLQVHHKQVARAVAGQRVAINLAGVQTDGVKRGDVLVSSNHFLVTNMIDIVLNVVDDLKYPLKQRSLIKCHIGTSEVIGKLIFFDRNEVEDSEVEILCQIRLNEAIVTKRGDRFILRRPTPVETIGGGWVVDPNGEKYRFGDKTIQLLASKKEGTPSERVKEILRQNQLVSRLELIKMSSLDEHSIREVTVDSDIIEISGGHFTLRLVIEEMNNLLIQTLRKYHENYPLRAGINKAEFIQTLSVNYPKQLIEFVLEQDAKEHLVKREDKYFALPSFERHFPRQWRKRMEGLLLELSKDFLHTQTWEDYLKQAGLSEKEGSELKYYLLATKQCFILDEKHIIHQESLKKSVRLLKAGTDVDFDIKEAKEILQASRKYLIPLLELMDNLKITKRVENKRVWTEENFD